MKRPVLDLSRHTRMLESLEGILAHRRAHPTTASDELYYELIVKYHRKIRQSLEKGEFIAAHTVLVPTEIIFALGLTPMHLEFTSGTMAVVLKNFEEGLNAARGLGLYPEICSTHRIMAGSFSQGWVPLPNAIVWSNMACDNTAKTAEVLIDMYQIPGFFVERPYAHRPDTVSYTAAEFRDMVAFLEKHSGRKLDPNRLEESLKLSFEMVRLHREINELRKASPYPLPNRRSFQMMVVGWYYQGSQEAVDYFRVVRDEAKALVEQKKGFTPNNRFRLLSISQVPYHNWKIMDWMEREHGACMVFNVDNDHWRDWQLDLSHPFETLATRIYQTPSSAQFYAPLHLGMVPDAVQDAKTYKVDGAVFWAHAGCREGCATIRSIKDALRDRVDIPLLALNMDFMDPTVVPEEEMKNQFEAFFERLAERR
ncbi:MAG: 2-hydroxyacyl-CoA dehydratase [Chloroflexi bacterium]|nr:2-hydroxyacyl-CoA dehydratase [Chloroflexota bacterium]